MYTNTITIQSNPLSSGQQWDLIMSIQLGTVSTNPCFILYIVSKRDQASDNQLIGLST